VAQEIGVNFVRAATVNDHPTFIRMLADVVRQRAQTEPSPRPSPGGRGRRV
jgi:protoheme ferro-lyase